ncbi:MAG: hypothetical protein WA130_07255 [Candidatus Methanoperedens sp.]
MFESPINNPIIAHCKGRYPREFGVPWRMCRFNKDIIKSQIDLINKVTTWNRTKGLNAYISVYSFPDIRSDNKNIETFRGLKESGIPRTDIFKNHKAEFEDIVNRDSAIIDCYYLDFDDETDPLKAIYEARNIVLMLKEDHGVKSRIYWSGNKGIALYIDFEPIVIEPRNIKGVVSHFDDYVRNLFHPLSKKTENPLKTLCDSTKDGQSRISRLPNTKHKSSGLYCIPLLESDLWNINPLEHIKELAKNPRQDIDLATIIQQNEKDNTEVMHSLTKKIESYIIKQREAQEHADKVLKATKPIYHNTGEWVKCHGVKHAEENGQVHPGREPTADGLILAYKTWGKYPIEKTKEIIKIWIETKCTPARDFPLIDERINKFYEKEKTYSPCSFLMKYGHCNGSMCSVMRKRGK